MKTTTKYIVGSVLASVLAVEGYYSYDPDDKGGETKYGITAKVASSYGYIVKDLTKEQAIKIYIDGYVTKPKFDLVIELSPAVGHKLIDSGVNVSPRISTVWFQKALNTLSNNGKDYPIITVDGLLGNKTLDAYKALVTKRGVEKSCQLTLKLLDAQQAVYYMSISSKFQVGWISERVGNVPYSYCKTYEYNTEQDILKYIPD